MTARQLALQIDRAYSGPTWHGPSLREALEGVDHRQAALHPVPGAHSIWELVIHIRVWADIAARRLAGESFGEPPPHEDWPPPSGNGADAWRQAVEDLHRSYEALAEKVRTLVPSQLEAKVDGLGYSTWTMLHGVVEHAAYHGGQIAILKRALEQR